MDVHEKRRIAQLSPSTGSFRSHADVRTGASGIIVPVPAAPLLPALLHAAADVADAPRAAAEMELPHPRVLPALPPVETVPHRRHRQRAVLEPRHRAEAGAGGREGGRRQHEEGGPCGVGAQRIGGQGRGGEERRVGVVAESRGVGGRYCGLGEWLFVRRGSSGVWEGTD